MVTENDSKDVAFYNKEDYWNVGAYSIFKPSAFKPGFAQDDVIIPIQTTSPLGEDIPWAIENWSRTPKKELKNSEKTNELKKKLEGLIEGGGKVENIYFGKRGKRFAAIFKQDRYHDYVLGEFLVINKRNAKKFRLGGIKPTKGGSNLGECYAISFSNYDSLEKAQKALKRFGNGFLWGMGRKSSYIKNLKRSYNTYSDQKMWTKKHNELLDTYGQKDQKIEEQLPTESKCSPTPIDLKNEPETYSDIET